MQICALCCIKLSVLFFYRRIFCIVKTGILHYLTILGIVLVSAWSVAFFFAFLLECGTSIDAHWGSIIESQSKCNDTFAIELGLAISDFIMDFLLLVLPLPTVR